jgi:hypothetical protein
VPAGGAGFPRLAEKLWMPPAVEFDVRSSVRPNRRDTDAILPCANGNLAKLRFF